MAIVTCHDCGNDMDEDEGCMVCIVYDENYS